MPSLSWESQDCVHRHIRDGDRSPSEESNDHSNHPNRDHGRDHTVNRETPWDDATGDYSNDSHQSAAEAEHDYQSFLQTRLHRSCHCSELRVDHSVEHLVWLGSSGSDETSSARNQRKTRLPTVDEDGPLQALNSYSNHRDVRVLGWRSNMGHLVSSLHSS